MAKTIEIKPEVKADLDKIRVGDILVGSYSYNMTFYYFYRVVKKNPASLTLQKLGKVTVGGSLYALQVKPVLNENDGKPFTRRIDKYGYMMENGRYSAMINIKHKYNPETSYEENHMD